jgi:uncharacterized DUF497 family protein
MNIDEKATFDWDETKDAENQKKHGIAFVLAQYAFKDPKRIISEDRAHSLDEERFLCIGRVDQEVITVRFTIRQDIVRIFGAGYWRKGRKFYEKENQIYK